MKCFEVTLYVQNNNYVGYLNYYVFARAQKAAENIVSNYWVRAFGYIPHVVASRYVSKEEVQYSVFEKRFDANDFERR